ncbi:MAG: protein kinase [Myxococcales bacterium]|nr:protein kinase [Myxococcales bacterium]MDH3482852.1 protein kinase [Myxococcales bacterium]
MEDTPQQIGRYRIERLLGSGSMGHVYLARDADLERPVAIKTLRDVDLDEESRRVFLSRFQNEARAAARLHHPNIVQIFDVGDDRKHGPYLVFEYVPGHTLKQQLRNKGPLPKDQLLHVAQQIADALATAHAAGVIHRDLKPENLLITDNGQVKLADFGIARVPNADLTKEGQFLGTPCYAAPETLLKGEYSEKTDLFSFGAVLYEAASGERAFPGAEAIVVAQNVMYKDPTPPSETNRGAAIPVQVDRVIMRALSKDPGARFASSRTLVSALREAYTGKAPKRPRRRRRSVPMIFVLLVGAALTAWALLTNQIKPPSADTDTRTSSGIGADAGTDVDTVAGTDTGTGPGAVADTDADAVAEPLSPHEREEAAKDELARAREALRNGDVAGAQAALDRATAYDPSNPDIEALRAKARR